MPNGTNGSTTAAALNNGNTGERGKHGGSKPKNGIGIIDAYAPSSTMTMLDPGTSDSEAGLR